MQVEIQSGRPHQIRTHSSFIGHPHLGVIFISFNSINLNISSGFTYLCILLKPILRVQLDVLTGDPLYCNGGMPKIHSTDSSNVSFAEDGYDFLNFGTTL
jgi:hypothetical protein